MPNNLYASISAQLRQRIAADIYTGLLPSERELQEEFKASRSVIRQAISLLVAEGLVYKEKGRGTVILPKHLHHRMIHSLNGIGHNLDGLAEETETTVTLYELGKITEAPKCWSNNRALHLHRLRSISSKPVAFIETWLPSEVAEKIGKEDLENQSLHALLRERAGINLECSSRKIMAIPASPNLSQTLKVQIGAPILLLEGTTSTRDGRFCEVFSTYHRGDSVIFDLEIPLIR